MSYICASKLVLPKARIPRRRHRQGHHREDPRRHVRHARFPGVIPVTRGCRCRCRRRGMRA